MNADYPMDFPAGWQNIGWGNATAGDLVVWDEDCYRAMRWYADCDSSFEVDGKRLYRRMPVAKQGDTSTKWREVLENSGFGANLKPTNPKDAIGSDKLPLHLWPTTATALGSLALLDGALKYGRSNFRAIGVRASIYFDAANRHMNAWFEGEDTDPDSGLPHLAHTIACMAVLIEAEAGGKLTDDRMFPAKYREFVESLTPHVARLKAKHAESSPKHFTIQETK